MLTIAKENRTTVTARVKVRDESGAESVVEIKLTGLVRAQSDWDALFARHGGDKVDQARVVSAIYRANAALYAEAFDGWDGVAGADGKPLSFGLPAMEALLDSPLAPAANRGLMEALNELRFGALEKN